MVCRGAETVVGFKEITYVSDCNRFAEDFATLYVTESNSVEQSIISINNSGYIKNMSSISAVGGNVDLSID